MPAWKINAVAVVIFLLSTAAAFANVVQKLDVKEQYNRTTLSFTFSGPFAYKAFTLVNPSRVVVDLVQTTMNLNLNAAARESSLIKSVRTGQSKKNSLRVVFDLNAPVTMKTTESARVLRIDLLKKSPLSSTSSQTIPKTSAKNAVVKVDRSPSKSLRDVVVVLDPGHGGKDPGAIGPTHHLEKNVVLAIALKLKKIIDNEPGMRAVLTRKDDSFVELRERLNIARKHDADVFISIHADAFNNRNSNGASVFALSQTGATSEAARWLAEKENYSELGGVNLSELDDQNDLVRSVLIDLSQTATIGASLEMGSNILKSMDKITNLHHQTVEQARFVVLKSPDIPSILIETGFISNPREEKNLSSPYYQTKLTQAIFKGLKQYFFAHPPHGTRIEAMAGFNRHLVKRGETLDLIASKHQVRVADIKAVNHLPTERLLPGQHLNIPKKWS